MTYGDHQEAASDALLQLLTSGRSVADDIAAVLACRRQVLLAVHERLDMLGVNRRLDRPHRTDRTIAAADYPLHVLQAIVHSMPAGAGADLAPSDVLAGTKPGASRAAELWRTLARHLTLGNADLTAQPDAASRSGSAEWYLIGDLGVTVDTLIVLDQRLATDGHLPRKPARSYLEDRLAVGGVTSVAAWRGTDPSPDHARAASGSPTEGVRLIRRPEDYAAAQRTLAGFTRPRPIEETLDLFGGRPGLHAARTIAAGQVRLGAGDDVDGEGWECGLRAST
jgi:hypothetical protein